LPGVAFTERGSDAALGDDARWFALASPRRHRLRLPLSGELKDPPAGCLVLVHRLTAWCPCRLPIDGARIPGGADESVLRDAWLRITAAEPHAVGMFIGRDVDRAVVARRWA
jgi:hypothetical protein